MGSTSRAETAYTFGAPEFTPRFLTCMVRVARSKFCVVFCRSLFVLLSFFFWPLRCLSFFDLRILITTLVSSNSSQIVTRKYGYIIDRTDKFCQATGHKRLLLTKVCSLLMGCYRYFLRVKNVTFSIHETIVCTLLQGMLYI